MIRLARAGAAAAQGFALNVSNFRASPGLIAYGRALGAAPAASTEHRLDWNLWIKRPGESDGACNGGPATGAFWPEYALGLAARATG